MYQNVPTYQLQKKKKFRYQHKSSITNVNISEDRKRGYYLKLYTNKNCFCSVSIILTFSNLCK